METVWIITLALILFALLSLLGYKLIRDFVRKTFGVNWMKSWTNQLYFWQSIVFMSTGGTMLIMYLLKWGDLVVY